MKQKKFFIFGVAILLWLIVALVDFRQVHYFEKPIFCILVDEKNDGGSGKYQGIGYSFDIEGNFMPQDEYPGVTKYYSYFFGIEVTKGIRD